MVGDTVETRDAKSDGHVGFNATMRYVTNGKGELVVISRSGEIVITDTHGRERERHKVPYGALLSVKADQNIKAGTVLANWDPLTRPIITEFAGKAKFENVEEGVTVAKQARLVAAARLYLMRRPDADCRFDVLLLDALEAGRVQWIRNAFTA